MFIHCNITTWSCNCGIWLYLSLSTSQYISIPYLLKSYCNGRNCHRCYCYMSPEMCISSIRGFSSEPRPLFFLRGSSRRPMHCQRRRDIPRLQWAVGLCCSLFLCFTLFCWSWGIAYWSYYSNFISQTVREWNSLPDSDRHTDNQNVLKSFKLNQFYSWTNCFIMVNVKNIIFSNTYRYQQIKCSFVSTPFFR